MINRILDCLTGADIIYKKKSERVVVLTSAESGTLTAAEVSYGPEGVGASTTTGVLSVTEQTIITSMPGFDAESDKVLFECLWWRRQNCRERHERQDHGWDYGKLLYIGSHVRIYSNPTKYTDFNKVKDR